MPLDEASAFEILDAAHSAWSRAEIDGVLEQFVDDLTYVTNAGGPDGELIALSGKAELRAYLRPIAQVTHSSTVIGSFQFKGDTGRAQIGWLVRHRRTGHVLTGSYRQVITDPVILQAVFVALETALILAIAELCEVEDIEDSHRVADLTARIMLEIKNRPLIGVASEVETPAVREALHFIETTIAAGIERYENR